MILEAQRHERGGMTPREKTDGGNKTLVSATITDELNAAITKLAAYNKFKKIEPGNDSALMREALDEFFGCLGFRSSEVDLLASPSKEYAQKLSELCQSGPGINEVKKSFSLAREQFDEVEAFSAYNKLHKLEPKNVSQTLRVALFLYFDSHELPL